MKEAEKHAKYFSFSKLKHYAYVVVFFFFFTFHLLIMILLLPRLIFRISLIFPRYFCVKISYLHIHILNIYLICLCFIRPYKNCKSNLIRFISSDYFLNLYSCVFFEGSTIIKNSLIITRKTGFFVIVSYKLH